jgi:hypothetical protein
MYHFQTFLISQTLTLQDIPLIVLFEIEESKTTYCKVLINTHYIEIILDFQVQYLSLS